MGSYVIQFIIIGISMGAVYALIALGYTTIFRASNIVNFAQGEFVMLGGLLTNFFLLTCGLTYPLSAVLAIMGVVFVGIGLQVLVIHPIRQAGILIMIMGTLGASMVISNVPIPLSSLPKLGYLRDAFSLPPITTSIEAVAIAGARISISAPLGHCRLFSPSQGCCTIFPTIPRLARQWNRAPQILWRPS